MSEIIKVFSKEKAIKVSWYSIKISKNKKDLKKKAIFI
jgi:hypothetical protein